MTLSEFKEFCRKVWSTVHNFFTLDLTSDVNNGKYRKNLDTFYFPTINTPVEVTPIKNKVNELA